MNKGRLDVCLRNEQVVSRGASKLCGELALSSDRSGTYSLEISNSRWKMSSLGRWL